MRAQHLLRCTCLAASSRHAQFVDEASFEIEAVVAMRLERWQRPRGSPDVLADVADAPHSCARYARRPFRMLSSRHLSSLVLAVIVTSLSLSLRHMCAGSRPSACTPRDVETDTKGIAFPSQKAHISATHRTRRTHLMRGNLCLTPALPYFAVSLAPCSTLSSGSCLG